MRRLPKKNTSFQTRLREEHARANSLHFRTFFFLSYCVSQFDRLPAGNEFQLCFVYCTCFFCSTDRQLLDKFRIFRVASRQLSTCWEIQCLEFSYSIFSVSVLLGTTMAPFSDQIQLMAPRISPTLTTVVERLFEPAEE